MTVCMRYVFGTLSVDCGQFRVERDGRPIELEPKAFDLLLLLIERRGEVVTKQEILDRVWSGTAVTDNALTRVVAQLRKALGDDARVATFIETVPTRGYRWLPEPDQSSPQSAVGSRQSAVGSPQSAVGGQQSEASGPGRTWSALAVAAVGVAIISAVVAAGSVYAL